MHRASVWMEANARLAVQLTESTSDHKTDNSTKLQMTAAYLFKFGLVTQNVVPSDGVTDFLK